VSVTKERQHYWDSARCVLMLLGIPYHVALACRAGDGWIVASLGSSRLFNYLADFIHLFRMPAFFVIAGYFTALLLARRAPGTWFRSKLLRLGVPLVVSLIVISPVLNILCELSNFPLAEALASMKHESLRSGGYWVRHLWFLIVLLYCSAAAALLVHVFPSLKQRMLADSIDRWVAQRFFPVLLLAALVAGLFEAVSIESFYKAGLNTNLLQEILRLDQLLDALPYFAIGCLLQRAPRTLEAFCRPSPSIIALAVLSIGLGLTTTQLVSPAVGRFIATFAALAMTQVFVSFARVTLNRPTLLVQRLVAASFVIYLVHLPITIGLIDLFRHLPLPVGVSFVSVVLLTLLLSYAVWLLIERSPLILLFGGTPATGRNKATAPPRGTMALQV
jgi:glucan biosynthesis protein C